jgi:hypothetical protein
MLEHEFHRSLEGFIRSGVRGQPLVRPFGREWFVRSEGNGFVRGFANLLYG